MNFQEISDANPDIIILMPCGFDTKRVILEYDKILKEDEKWNALDAVKKGQIYAVDANSFFSKPSIRTIEGIEILSKIINPKKTKELVVSADRFTKIGK